MFWLKKVKFIWQKCIVSFGVMNYYDGVQDQEMNNQEMNIKKQQQHPYPLVVDKNKTTIQRIPRTTDSTLKRIAYALESLAESKNPEFKTIAKQQREAWEERKR